MSSSDPPAPACPICGGTAFSLEITVVSKLYVQFYPGGEHDVEEVKDGDFSWEDHSPAYCLAPSCTWAGTVAQLEAP